MLQGYKDIKKITSKIVHESGWEDSILQNQANKQNKDYKMNFGSAYII